MPAFVVTYKGINYRSKTEGQWAVFLDTLNIPFSPEPGGYKLPSGPYSPDFWLPEQGVFVEIKPTKPTQEEEDKAQELASTTGYRVFIFYGLPLDYVHSHANVGAYGYDPEGYTDREFQFTECPTCGLIEIVLFGLINNLSCRCSTDGSPGNESDKLRAAEQKSRQAFNRVKK